MDTQSELQRLIDLAVAEDTQAIPVGFFYAVGVFVTQTADHFTQCFVGKTKDAVRAKALIVSEEDNSVVFEYALFFIDTEALNHG